MRRTFIYWQPKSFFCSAQRYTKRSINYLSVVVTRVWLHCARLTDMGSRGKLGTQFLHRPLHPGWQIFPPFPHIDRSTCSHNNPQPEERMYAKRSEPPVVPTCVQNRRRHSNIFSLACVLIRALINACHDAAPSFSFLCPLFSPCFILAFLSIVLSYLPASSQQSEFIFTWLASVIYHCSKTICFSLPESPRAVPLRLPSFTFFTTDRSEDGTVINSLLLCRFFAVIHNYCNARSAARTVLFNFTDKSRLRLSKWKNRSHSCFSIILASVSFVRGLEIDEKR